jgi:hypothetical protein
MRPCRVEPSWVQRSGFQQFEERILIGGSVLESSFERVKKDHLPIRLLDKGIAHSSYCQQSMRPGQQPLPIMRKPGAICCMRQATGTHRPCRTSHVPLGSLVEVTNEAASNLRASSAFGP